MPAPACRPYLQVNRFTTDPKDLRCCPRPPLRQLSGATTTSSSSGPGPPGQPPRCCWLGPATTSCSLDRAQLPSDTTSTHSLVRGGVVQLSRWGLLGDVLDSGAPPVRSVLFQQHGEGADAPLRLPVKDKAGVDMMLAPRRYVLDAILADAAVRAGATLMTGTTVTDVVRRADGRVTGVLAHEAGTARRLELTARLVIGADGVRSRTADLVRSRVLRVVRAERHLPLHVRRRGALGRLRVPPRPPGLRRRVPDPPRRGRRLADPPEQPSWRRC